MIFFLTIALIFTNAFSIPKGTCSPCNVCREPKQICCEKPPEGPFAFAYPKDVGLVCPVDFYFFGEFLYLQAEEEGLEYALTDSPCPDLVLLYGLISLRHPETNARVQGFNNNQHNWHWNPGFRVGFGFHLYHDAWDIEATFTGLNITNSIVTDTTGSERLTPLWMTGDQAIVQEGVRSSARWKADFNSLDLQLKKPYYTNRYCTLAPHFGLRFALIDQFYKIQYSGNWSGENGASYLADNDFVALGTRLGIDCNFILACNAGLYTNISGSICYGKFEVNQTYRGGPGADGADMVNTMNSDISLEYYKNVTNFEMQTGLYWGTFFCDRRYHLTLRLGWEFHVWTGQNQMRKFTSRLNPIYNDTGSRGDLTFNGISFRAQLDL